MLKLSRLQREAVAKTFSAEGVEAAITQCESLFADNVAGELLRRGGHATLQLGEEGAVPRLRFVDRGQAREVVAAKIGGATIARSYAPG